MRLVGAALTLATLLASASAFTNLHVDDGDALVRLVSEKLRRGEDWRQLEAPGQDDAVTADQAEDRELALMAPPKPMTTTKTFQAPPKPKPQPKKKPQVNSRAKAKQQALGWNTKQAKAMAPGESELQGTKQKGCSWQAYVTGKMMNKAYPDTQAIYQVLVLHKINENKIFRIRGKFPTKGVKYFSFQSNNKDAGFPLATIKDFQIEPDAGSGRNPFRTDSDERIGTYTINFTPRGNQGLPNELALCPAEWPDTKCRDIVAVVLMRIYTSDPDRPPANSKVDPPISQNNPRLFGFEAPPKVEIRNFKTAMKETWKNVPTCDQTRPTLITAMLQSYFAKLIPPFPDPPRYNRKDGFEMYLGEDTSNAGVFPNLDASYLLAAAWQKPITEPGARIVAKVTGVLPMTARNLEKGPKIASYLDYDVRYASFSTIGLVEGGPTCDTLDDAAFIRFYGDRPGWNERRTFTIVAAEDPARTCGLYDPKNDLFLTTTLDGTPQDYWGLLYRQLIPKTARTQEADHSNGYARLSCTEMAKADNLACQKSEVLESVMGDFYPHLEYFTCGADGKTLTPITNPDWYKGL